MKNELYGYYRIRQNVDNTFCVEKHFEIEEGFWLWKKTKVKWYTLDNFGIKCGFHEFIDMLPKIYKTKKQAENAIHRFTKGVQYFYL